MNFLKKAILSTIVFFCWNFLISLSFWYLNSPISYGTPSILKSISKNIEDYNLNWGDNTHCDKVTKFKNKYELQNYLNNSPRHNKIRVMGFLHSWSPVACGFSDNVHLNWCQNPAFLDIDKKKIRVDAGCKLKNVQDFLSNHKKMLHGYGGVQEQSIAGAIMTSLHGGHFRTFSSNVDEITIMFTNGTIKKISEQNELNMWFNSAGMLGFVLDAVIKTFDLVTVEKHTKKINFNESINFYLNNKNQWYAAVGNGWFNSNNNDIYFDFYTNVQNTSFYESFKYDVGAAYFYDNIMKPFMLLFPSIINNIDANSFINNNDLNKIKKFNALDAWATPFPGHGIQSSEYTVPIHLCKNAMQQVFEKVGNKHIYAFVLRFLHAEKYNNAFAQNESCVLDFGFADIGTNNFEQKQFNFYKSLEQILSKYGGKPHLGKLIVSNWTNLFHQNFLSYKKSVDPNNKLLNPYLLDLIQGKRVFKWSDRFIKPAISKRKTIWMFFAILSFTLFVFILFLSFVLLTIACKKKITKKDKQRIRNSNKYLYINSF